MNIDKYKQQHVQILSNIAALRKLTHEGVKQNANEITALIASMSSVIKIHLAIEDRILYPTLRLKENADIARLGMAYQEEMKGIASSYIAFSRRWNTAVELIAHPEKFRDEANVVLKTVHARIVKENTKFYPAIEAA